LAPWLAVQTVRFQTGVREAAARNAKRLRKAKRLDLPELQNLEMTVVVEERHSEGFIGDAAVSYLLRNENGGMLMDLGFGADRPAFRNNAARLGIGPGDWGAVFVSHLHPDHMGGLKAARRKTIDFPRSLAPKPRIPCYTPAPCAATNLIVDEATAARVLPNGFATTGPLARMLCFTGVTEEQAVVARLKDKGLVVILGCGHPTVELVLRMVRRLSDAPIYAVAGGLHLPIVESRGARFGIQFQQIVGTGKPWWRKIGDDDLDRTIRALNESGAKRLLLSAHDSCDYALERIADAATARVDVLTAGVTYCL
jgi:7,8-dihydropterin-6-yl-methyl-4-(beta-D-ribofuranosyl)aminobenzene 5'-phosphate synthase